MPPAGASERMDGGAKKQSAMCHVFNEKGTFGGTFVVHSGYIRVHSGIFRYIRKNSVTIRPHKNQHFRKVLQIWQVHSPHAPQPFIILKGEIAQDALITSWDASRLLEFYARFCSWFLSAGFFLFPSPTLPNPPFQPTLPRPWLPAAAPSVPTSLSPPPKPPNLRPFYTPRPLSRLPHFP